MKRLVIAAMVLALIGTFAFADAPTAKWSIGTWTGFGIQSAGGVNTIEQYDYNWVGGDFYRVGFTYTAADGNAGFNSRLQMGISAQTAPAVFNQLNAWGKFFGGMLTVRAGINDDYTIATKDWNTFGTTDGAFGVYVNVTPMEGLDIGYFQPVPTYQAFPLSEALAPYSGKNAIVGLAYTMKDMVSIQAGAIAAADAAPAAVYYGLKLLAVKDLTAILEGKSVLSGAAAVTTLLENVGYNVGALSISARIGEAIGSTFNWGVEPIVTYKANDMVSVSVIGNVFTSYLSAGKPAGQYWMSPIDGGAVSGGNGDGTINGGAGAFITFAQSGASLIVGDYYAAAINGGNVVFVNLDLSL